MLFKFILIPVYFIFAVFYLFILPPLVATGSMEMSALNTGFAAFMLFQVWMLIAEFAYQSASAVFGFRRKRLFSFLMRHRYKNINFIENTGFSVILLAFLSYLFMIYGYGVIYMYMSAISQSAFSIGKLGIVDGVYFSIVNSSTVGFGDITPKSSIAKLVVISQIIISMAYIVMLFSSAVSYVRDEASRPNKSNHNDEA